MIGLGFIPNVNIFDLICFEFDHKVDELVMTGKHSLLQYL